MTWGIKSYLSLLLVLSTALFSVFLLHGNLLVIPDTVPPEYTQLLVLFLITADLYLIYFFYRKYRQMYFLFGLAVIIAIFIPHILHGHILVPESYAQKYAQSIVLLLNLGLFYIFYWVYKHDTKELKSGKTKAEKELREIYKYIGQVNAKIGLFDKFMNLFYSDTNNKKKELFNDLLMTIINSVAKADMGFIRFTDTDSGKTIKEFYYSKKEEEYTQVPASLQDGPGNLVNKDIKNSQNISTVTNDYNKSQIKCTLGYAKKDNGQIDDKLLKTLLNQIHLLFLINNKK